MGFREVRLSITNPPAERLAKVEYKSYLYQAFGILFATIILVYKGIWYIVFAFIFGIGICYSNGMTAYRKWKFIKETLPKENPKDFDKDISFTRRRSKIIEHTFGSWFKYFVTIICVILSYVFMPIWNRLLLMLYYPISILFWYTALYFLLAYWIAHPIYNKNVKGGSK